MWPKNIGHTGSWGTPELGISEFVSGLFRQPQTTPQGGSNLSGVFTPQAQGPLVSPLPSTGPIGQNIPSPTPQFRAPQPQPQQQTGGVDLTAGDLQSLFGFNDPTVINAILGSPGERARYVTEKNMRGQVSSFVPQGPSAEEISSIYDPAFQTLAGQERFLRETDYPNALADIARQSEELKKNLTTAEQEAGQQFKTLTGELGSQQESALSEARRAYQGLSQGARARFGSGSSAGPAAQEILGQEHLRQQGKIQQNFATQYQKLFEHQANTAKYVVMQKSAIDQQTADLERQAQRGLQEKLLQIEYSKNQLESAKASARIDALNQARNAINQLQIQRITALLNLENWKAQQQYLIDAGLSQLQQQVPIIQPFQNPGSFLPASTHPAVNQPQIVGQRRTDEFTNLVNPFA